MHAMRLTIQQYPYRVLAIALFLAYLFDRMTKLFALERLEQAVVLIPRVLQLELIGNTNFLFYWDVSPVLMFISIAVVMVCMLVMSVREYMAGHIVQVGLLALILVGACSNILDRIRYGFVIDFINVPFWSVFNVADIYIVVGALALLLYTWKHNPTNDAAVSANH